MEGVRKYWKKERERKGSWLDCKSRKEEKEEWKVKVKGREAQEGMEGRRKVRKNSGEEERIIALYLLL